MTIDKKIQSVYLGKKEMKNILLTIILSRNPYSSYIYHITETITQKEEVCIDEWRKSCRYLL